MSNDEQPWLTGIPLELLLRQFGDPGRAPAVGGPHPFAEGDEVLVNVHGYDGEYCGRKGVPAVCKARLVIEEWVGGSARLRIKLEATGYRQWGFWRFVVGWRPCDPERLK